MRWRTIETFRHSDRTMLVHRPPHESVTGPQFVLVHGIGVSARYYTRLARALAPSGGVHVVDLPGFGQAPRPDTPLRIEDHAEVLNAYVRSAGLHQPLLVGHSMGTQVVVEAALQAPDLHAGVVAIGGVVDPAARTAPLQALRLAQDVLREPPLTNWTVLSGYARTGLRWYLRTLPAMLGYRTEEALPRLSVPLLVVRGSRDPIATGPWSAQMGRLGSGGRVVEIAGAAHVAMHTHPDQVAAAILEHARAVAGHGAA
jgi:pimeloyl-ACP methyl ester carboxylesterase